MTEWRDPVSGVAWTYQLMVFPDSSEVELFDVKNRRTFLRKSKLEDMKPELFFVGGKVTVFGRQLNITDYGDAYTRKALEGAQQRCETLSKRLWAVIRWLGGPMLPDRDAVLPDTQHTSRSNHGHQCSAGRWP